MHTELRAQDHQGVAHVVAGVSHVCELNAFQIPEMLPDRERIRQHLRRVVLIRETIPHRNTRVLCQLLHDLLPVAAVLDPLVHSAEHARRVRDGLLLADLRARGIEVSRPHAEIMRRHLKRTARARARLLKDQGDIFPAERIVQDPLLLLVLIPRRQIDQINDLLRRKIL